MRKLFLLMASAAIIGLGFISCDNDDDFIPDAIGDAYIKTVKIGDDVKHGLVLYAYANEYIASAKVGTPVTGADSIELTNYENTKIIFREYPTEDADFSTTAPAKGMYGFVIITENGNTLKRSDDLKETTLSVADLTESIFADNEIHVKFPRIENADAYVIRLVDSEGERVFNSDLYSNSSEEENKDFVITNNSRGWYQGKSISNVKKMQLIAIKYENSRYFNPNELDCISEAEKVKAD